MVQSQKPKAEIYPSAINAIINSTKLLDSGIYHNLYTLRISNIDMNNKESGSQSGTPGSCFTQLSREHHLRPGPQNPYQTLRYPQGPG